MLTGDPFMRRAFECIPLFMFSYVVRMTEFLWRRKPMRRQEFPRVNSDCLMVRADGDPP